MPVYVEDEFFALKLCPNKTYTQDEEATFRLTMATLNYDLQETDAKKHDAHIKGHVMVCVRIEEEEHVLCHLRAGHTDQFPLNLVFVPSDHAMFYMKTLGTESGIVIHGVHLTGNYVSFENEFEEGYGETLGPFDSDDEDEDLDIEDDEEIDSEMSDFIVDDEEDESDAGAAPADRKKSPKIKEIAEGKSESDEDSEGEDDEDDEDFDDIDDEDFDSEDFDQDSEDDSDVESDESEESDEEVVAEKKQDQNKRVIVDSPSQQKKAKTESTPEAKKPKEPESKKPEEKKTPTKKVEEKKVEEKKNEPKKQEEKKPEVKQRQVQGVTIEDVQVGNGQSKTAKKGNKVGILYKGTLSNGKVFDSNMNKPQQPFTFSLGAGQVIKGFDIGVEGMHINGVRRVTIPPHLAYGNKALPNIPKNSTLHFEIKLVNIH